MQSKATFLFFSFFAVLFFVPLATYAHEPNVSVFHSPISPNSEQTVDFFTSASHTNPNLTSLVIYIKPPGSGERFSDETSCSLSQSELPCVTRGPWPEGTTIEYYAIAQAGPGHFADTRPIRSFTVVAAPPPTPRLYVTPASPPAVKFTEPPETVAVGGWKNLVFTVQNTASGGPSLFGNVSSSDPAFGCSGQCNYSLGPGSQQNITIKFSPQRAGPTDAVITFGNNAGNPIAVNVTGDGSGVRESESPFRISSVAVNPTEGAAPLNNVRITAEYSGGSGTVELKLRCQGSGTFDATENVVGGTEHTFARTCNYPTAGGYTVTVSGTRGGVSDSNYTTVRASSSSAPTTGTGGFFDCPQPEGGGIKICNPLQADSFTDLIDNILGFIFMIASALVPLMVVLAGFLFVTGGGNPDKIKQAKNILLWTVIGFTIILLSGGLVALLQNILGT